MKKILWLSRYAPIREQLEGLQFYFGPHDLIVEPEAYGNADDIAQRIRDEHFDEVVFVGPQTVLKELCDRGLRPLQAVMHRERVGFSFEKFRRVIKVTVETEELTPLEAEVIPVTPERIAAIRERYAVHEQRYGRSR